LRSVTAASKPWLAAAIAWTVAILAINSISVPHSTWQPPFAGADKLTHAALYGAAAYAWRRAFRARGDAVSWWVVVGFALVGAFDEWHQRSVPGRSAEALDWMADVIGACLGVLAWRRLHAPQDARS
jgi:VanZ family protein